MLESQSSAISCWVHLGRLLNLSVPQVIYQMGNPAFALLTFQKQQDLGSIVCPGRVGARGAFVSLKAWSPDDPAHSLG